MSKQRSLKQLQGLTGGNLEPTATSDYPSSPPPFPSAILARDAETTAGEPEPQISSTYEQALFRKPSVPTRNRVESGESMSRNEEISLVQVANGQINYAASSRADSQQLNNNVRQNLGEGYTRRFSNSDHSRLGHSIGSAMTQIREDDPCCDLTTQSLPEGLSIDTEAFISKGGFVNILRGGCPIDESFQRRPLSPSSFQLSEIPSSASNARSQNIIRRVDSSHLSSHRSTLDSFHAPPTSTAPPITPTKNQSHENSPPKSSGSPLKLFDAYDTYTNDRLIRRMSQFAEDVPDSHAGDLLRNDRQRSPSSYKMHQTKKLIMQNEERRATSFGSGDFDEYDFTHRQLTVLDPSSDNRADTQETLPMLPEIHGRALSRKRSNQSPVARLQTRRASLKLPSEQKLKFSRDFPFSEQPRLVSDGDDSQSTEIVKTTSLELGREYHDTHNVVGKRFPPSPIRDPKPKRRCTITSSLDQTEEARNLTAETSATTSAVSRKRKDARYDGISQAADPEVLASRPMLRPRMLSSSQVQNTLKETSSQKSNGVAIHGQSSTTSTHPTVVSHTRLSLDDTPVKALAGELAHFAYDVAQDIAYGDRKTSVTTADFTTAANLIMQNIRAQARPRSGRTSGEESEMEPLADIEESVNEGSTIEEFSRPPSRVRGGTLRRLRDNKQLDPRVISHLRKFEENDDTGIVLSSSLQSLKLGQENVSTDSFILDSDPPNIRIRGSLDVHLVHDRGDHTDEKTGERAPKERESSSHRSQPSSGLSTARSVPTGSSSGSGKKAMIAPEKVSHLISDNIGGMTFDRTRQVWIRKRSAENSSNEDPDKAGSELTEDDPLKEIPDLSVDELEELRRIQNTTLSSQPSAAHLRSNDGGPPDGNCLVSNELESHLTLPPETSISIPSNHSQRVSNTSNVEPTMTLFGHQTTLNRNTSYETRKASEVPEEQRDADSEEIDHEISILEGRNTLTPGRHHQTHRQPRVVTVTFSSPLTGPVQMEGTGAYDFEEMWDDNSDVDLGYSPEKQRFEKSHTYSRKISTGYRSHGSLRARRRVSTSKRNFPARPVSRIDEYDELSMDQSSGQIQKPSIDVILSTPQQLGYRPSDVSMHPLSTGLHSHISFHLSPLSDFTIHRNEGDVKSLAQEDRSRQFLSSPRSEERYSLAIRELVEKITDVEPYEPYWECIRKLDLQRKSLTTLHMLDEFCGRIEELDVSNNNLGQLDGAPVSIRVLRIRHNCLSNLTAWGHFHNLQYLDVSGNQIQSLRGFNSLIHLRELKADDNQIESLDGIADLNGLIRLGVKRNTLKSLDFSGYDLFVIPYLLPHFRINQFFVGSGSLS